MDGLEKYQNSVDFEDRLTALGESEMEMFRFLLGKPAGVILTVDTDRMLAELLERESLVVRETGGEEGDKVIIPAEVRAAYGGLDPDVMTLKWRKRNWMYKCIEAGKYLYGVMTWDALKDMFALRYPDAGIDEVRRLFDTTPLYYQWFTERGGRLVLNGFERDNYCDYLEKQIQGDVPFYVPTKEEIEELYEQGSLISRESHQKLKAFIEDTFGCDPGTATLKLHDLYETVNNHMRVNDVVDYFAKGGSAAAADAGDRNASAQDAAAPDADADPVYRFDSDETEYKFLELYMEMSRECRIRDNRGHDHYEMVAIMAGRGRDGAAAGSSSKNKAQVKRVKIGRNDPCPCGSGKKYKNCCGRVLN